MGLRASPPILKNGWTQLILWVAALKSAPPILQNGWTQRVLGLEVEVGLQIGVILQVGAPAPKQKRSPLNNKGQTPYSSPISKVPMRFILLLFFPCFITMYTSHGWGTQLANQLNSTYCEDDPPCILWDGWWCPSITSEPNIFLQICTHTQTITISNDLCPPMPTHSMTCAHQYYSNCARVFKNCVMCVTPLHRVLVGSDK